MEVVLYLMELLQRAVEAVVIRLSKQELQVDLVEADVMEPQVVRVVKVAMVELALQALAVVVGAHLLLVLLVQVV
jgi:hypothetical protein